VRAVSGYVSVPASSSLWLEVAVGGTGIKLEVGVLLGLLHLRMV
jgi:hypothetical protein